MNRKVRVLVVDDSAFYRKRITESLHRSPEIEVVGSAGDGVAALREVRRLKPDVVTMDVEMPVMDGITATRRIMSALPTPILMFSAMTHQGARATLDALDAGAVDFLPKQSEIGARGEGGSHVLQQRVLTLGHRGQLRRKLSAVSPPARIETAGVIRRGHYHLVAIGASTGGPVAIQKLLTSLPAGFPLPILLVVHMPASFTPAYAERLDSQCSIKVKEAADGDRLSPGQAYLAPGGKQMLLDRQGPNTLLRIKDAGPEQIYKPSVDVTLGSAARIYPDRVLSIILTGMGTDGKQAARLLKKGGSTVWSQDEASCVVYGMPQAVEKAGLSDQVLALDDIGPMLGRLG